MKRNLIAASAGLLFLAASAKATIIYDNISASTGAVTQGDAGIASDGPLGDSFSTGSSPSALTDVQVLLDADTPTDGGAVTMSLFSDSSTMPGTLISTLGTIPDSSLGNSPAVADVPVTTPISLAANTRYWVELSAVGSANWNFDVTNVGIGVANEFNLFQGGVSDNNSFTPYQMTVSATAVPEPATLSLVAVGVTALGLRRRRA